jgi:hypothetical protein
MITTPRLADILSETTSDVNMKNYFSDYYESTLSQSQLLVLTTHYQAYCKNEGLLPVYTENDVKLAVDSEDVDQTMINHFLTFQKQYT